MLTSSHDSDGDAGVWAAMEQRVVALEQKVATCHLRRACPRCGAELGELCLNLTRSPSSTRRWTVKHPHRERWIMEVPVR